MVKQCWKCSDCGQVFYDETDAEECESIHMVIDDLDIVHASYNDEIADNHPSGYPTTLVISGSDKKAAIYVLDEVV